MKQFVTSFVLFIFLTGCGSDDKNDITETPTISTQCDAQVINKGSRLLGMDILDETPTSTYFDNFAKASEANIDFVHVHLNWSAIEVSPMTYTDPGGALDLFNNFVEQSNTLFNLTIRPIDLTGKTVPSDLETTRFNDPAFIKRFTDMLDFVFTKLKPVNLTNIQIGNEIDGYDFSNEHPDFWSDYGFFLEGINTHLDTNYPGLKMGYTGTFEGLTSGSLHELGVFKAFSNVVDVIGVTYYPIDNNFQVAEPSDVGEDMNELVNEFPGKTIYLQEVGYQTSSTSSSSEAKQAEFICNFFQAWDEHISQIPLANFVRLHDSSEQGARDLAGPYGLSSIEFIEYLRTLGLRTQDGKDKAGFIMLVEQTKKRGW